MAHKWTVAARKRLSSSLKRFHALKKLTHVTRAEKQPIKPKSYVPQGAKDFDSILMRFSRLERSGQQFVIEQILASFSKRWGSAG